MDVGATLRDAREQRGISLEDLSRTTKISLPTLQAIERNQVDRLPGGIFTRGFLRAYAGQVGLDGEDIVKRYLAQFDLRPGATEAGEKDGASESARPVVSQDDVNESSPHGVSRRMLLAGVALAIGAAGYFALHGWGTPAALNGNTVPGQKTAAPAESESRPPSTPLPAAGATSGSQGASASAIPQDGVRVDIHTQQPCWLSATADGMSVAYSLMQPGERRAIQAREEIILRVGDAGALTYLINDLPGRALGRAGQPVTVRMTPQNVREFVGP